MTKDLVYVFNKLNNRSSLLGEIQSNFNMSLVIDGTKDSTTIIVWSYSEEEIEPWSVILHEKTMTWWCVSHDKVERYQNDDGSFVWLHNLELNGAVELLNARDLTDCGFNDNTYTVGDFIQRLFSLSNAEYSLTINAENNFLNQNVDFIKTFENYTLLSALREFLDAYNMCPKITFSYVTSTILSKYTLTGINLKIIPKTGNRSRVHQMNDFDDVRETKTMDKNSFGTCVVSNAENVVSSIEKIYPSVGGVLLSSTGVDIKPENAILRLPSKVFQAKWIKLYYYLHLTLSTKKGNDDPQTISFAFRADIPNSMNRLIEKLYNFIKQHYTQQYADFWLNDFNQYKDSVEKQLKLASVITFYEGNKVIPYFGQSDNQTGQIIIEQGDDVPYLAHFVDNTDITRPNRPIIFTDKESKGLLQRTWQGIAWERGSNEITGFDIFSKATDIEDLRYTDLQQNIRTFYSSTVGYDLDVNINVTDLGIDPNDTLNIFGHPFNNGDLQLIAFKVCYIPMSDIKIKVDNQRDKRDIQLYNQNGKLTDSVALSKLLNSYSKEISSDTITKYMHYYSYNDVPQVGDIVIDGNVEYVINNVSIDFAQNETSNENDFGYFLDCEITMSKYVSTKSLMVNPNTNIRDYGIPQNYNVKRKQLYRDYYELSYYYDDNANLETPYLSPSNIFNFLHNPSESVDFIGLLKLGYSDDVASSNYWYYQLETTTYYLNKMIMSLLDFNDNNIIGYGSQNVWSGFVISRIFTGLTDNLNTPISYVDDAGRVESIDLKLCSKEKIETVYQYYQDNVSGGIYANVQKTLYNYSVFIPQEIYDDAEEDIRITEESYNKDALEVPVFEYVCQIDDSKYVLIGDNILKQYSSDFVYFYSYVYGNNINQNNAFTTTRIAYDSDNGVYVIQLACDISFASNELSIGLYENCRYAPSTDYWQLNNKQSFRKDQDYAFFRHSYNIKTGEEIIDLMFIAKKVQKEDNTDLVLKVNHYKLK